MPYTSIQKKTQRHRERRVKPLEAPTIIEAPITEAPEWQAVKTYISRPTVGMPNLERIQRIAGSLGKLADHVWFGVGGLSVGDIGRVIGTLPPMIPK